MKNSYTNIFGKWNLIVDTPFGKENYNFDVLKHDDTFMYKAYNEKGHIDLSYKEIKDNKIFLEGRTEFPIPCNLMISFQINDDSNIFGKIHIDEYIVVDFVGVK